MAKDYSTDGVRGLAILAVITIHATSAYLFRFDDRGSLAWQLKVAVDQIARFAVPLFVAVSGFALAKKYGTRKFSLVKFYLRRVGRLLPWYLLASVVLYLLFQWQPKTWKQILFLGQGDYQLYFVPMILQFYLLFPLLNWLTKKRFSAVLLAALIFEIFWYWYIGKNTELFFNNNGIWPDQRQYVFFTSWIFYFVLGMFLARHQLAQKLGWLLAILGVAWALVNSFALLNSGMDLIVATRFTRLPVLLYATGLIVALQNFPWRNQVLTTLGKYSFLIFLWHTAVLRFLFDNIAVQNFLPYPLVLLAAVTLSYFLARVLAYVV